MLSKIKQTLSSTLNSNQTLPNAATTPESVLKIDTNGFVEFPSPDDFTKQFLPNLYDPEEDESLHITEENIDVNDDHLTKALLESDFKSYWMPDKLCKVCYSCEEPFTMFRRKHHCRMCGQVFCNPCSSYYIDGSTINLVGLVRCCKLCSEQVERDAKLSKKKNSADQSGGAYEAESRRSIAPTDISSMFLRQKYFDSTKMSVSESPTDKMNHATVLQNRASGHLESIMKILVKQSNLGETAYLWEGIIISLIRDVVSAVDPNVKEGDSIDIRNYVKLKIIPGGQMTESIFVDGVVFRKTVAHKKMMNEQIDTSPRILLLSGGIDFQRMDTKLSSMDTLIEQEDKYMEILVEKIMSLKPVGKSVARKAQELFCNHKVIVIQNVKLNLLERISRMTGAKMLPSTDHMFQQSGQDCLGTCGKFTMRIIQDDPEKMDQQKSQRILKTRIARGTTYAYLEGCPSEKGCTIVLRGGDRQELTEVKSLISFGIIIAYHLRLEVAYYSDRYAILAMSTLDTLKSSEDPIVADESDDEYVDMGDDSPSHEEKSMTVHRKHSISAVPRYIDLRSSDSRVLLSTSLDVDFSLPYATEIRGFGKSKSSKYHNMKSSPVDHQWITITSILMHDSSQKSRAEKKTLKYYSSQDSSLGQFLIENCFNIQRNMSKETTILDQTLCFIHRTGRIEVTVTQLNNTSPSIDIETLVNLANNSKFNVLNMMPIYMTNYCKLCNAAVTPEVLMSDETWKMSFGKFLEMTFYNRTARCRLGRCSHSLRDDMMLVFTGDVYTAKFNFIPIHPFSLFVRQSMEFKPDFHMIQAYKVLISLPNQYAMIIDTFRKNIYKLLNEVKEVFSNRGVNDEYSSVVAEIGSLDAELQSAVTVLSKNISLTLNNLPRHILAYFDRDNEGNYSSSGNSITVASSPPASTLLSSLSVGRNDIKPIVECDEDENEDVNESTDGSNESKTVTNESVHIDQEPTAADSKSKAIVLQQISKGQDDSELDMKLKYPMAHRRQIVMQVNHWNSRISSIARRLESIKENSTPLLPISSPNAIAAPSQGTITTTVPTIDVGFGVGSDSEMVSPTLVALPVGILGSIESSGSARLARNSNYGLSSPVSALTQPETVGDKNSEEIVQHSGSLTDNLSSTTTRIEYNEQTTLPVANFSLTAYNSNEFAPSSAEGATDEKPTNESSIPSAVEIASSTISFNPSVSITPSATASVTTNFESKRQSATFDIDKATSVALEAIGLPQLIKPLESKSQNKQSRLTKALARFVMGKDNYDDDEKKFEVNIGELGDGRLTLPVGRKGEVIHISDEEPATIIAYSLASNDYYNQLQELMREDYEELDSDEDIIMTPKAKHSPRYANLNNINDDPNDSSRKNPDDDIDYEEDDDENDQDRDTIVDDMDDEEDDSPNRSTRPLSNDKIVNADIENANKLINDSDTKTSTPNKVVAEASSEKSLKKGKTFAKLRTTAVSQALANALSTNQQTNSTEESTFMTFPMNEAVFSLDEEVPLKSRYLSQVSQPSERMTRALSSASQSASGPPPLVKNSSQFRYDDQTNLKDDYFQGQPIRMTSSQSDTFSSDPSLSSAYTGQKQSGGPTAPKYDETRRHQLEKQLLSQRKSHIKIRFEDHDEKGNVSCKFQCQAYWATQFEAVRASYLNEDDNEHYIRSLAMTKSWSAKGGKSGASFSKTLDDRFVIKVINRVEMQMFLDFAPAYFEYLVKAFFHNLPTVLCKILGVYTVGYHNRETGKKVLDNIVVMENIFYQRNITGVFDLKGSSRARYLEIAGEKILSFDDAMIRKRLARRYSLPPPPRTFPSGQVLLDDNLMELTKGRPFPLKYRAKLYFTKAVTNDTLFLKMVDVVDYSIVVGFDEDTHEIVVGIIDYLRKYDIVKKMERMGKSVGMLTGQAEPTIIQPPQYRNRFQTAMDKYFMTVPDAWQPEP